MTYQLMADVVLSLHVAIVIFVIVGWLLIVVGNLASWQWVNALWFRVVHLLSIAIVVAESWLGIVCPLTTIEMWLRDKAGERTYQQSFIEHWLQQLLYYDAPTWVFTAAYTVFALLVAATWWYWPPRLRRRKN